MILQQNQLWKLGDEYIRLVHIERLHVEYKTMKDPITKEGTRSRSTKKEFCRLIKGATKVTISTRLERDAPPVTAPESTPADQDATPAGSPAEAESEPT